MQPLRRVGLQPIAEDYPFRIVAAVRFARHPTEATTTTTTATLALLSTSLLALLVQLRIRRAHISPFLLVCSPSEIYYACRREAMQPDKPFRWHEWMLLKMVAWLNGKLTRHYIVLSEHLAEVVRSHGTAAAIDIAPVYGVDTNCFRPATERRTALRERLGLPPRDSIVFFSSRIAPEKDSRTLLRAFRELRETLPNAWLLNVSGGFEEFRQAARQFGLLDHVIAREAVDPRTELPAWYQASDVCAQASRAEGLGFSVLEALACGIPVVAESYGR